MRLAALAPALLLVLPAGCALGPGIPRAHLTGWSVVDAAELRLLGDIPAAELESLAADLALFDASFAHLLRSPPSDAGVRVRIVLIRERELARRFGLGNGIGGWALPTLDGSFSAVEAGGAYVETRSILFHEYTHVLLRRDRRAPVPPWYDEGLASFFATLSARDGAVVVGAAPGAAVWRLASRGPLPLGELFEGNIWGRSAEGVADFYATSWALCHYLLLTPRGRREMSRLVDQLPLGVAPELARAALGGSSEQLEVELREYVGQLGRGVPAEVVLEAHALDIRDPGRVASLRPGETACELGVLALQLATTGRRKSEQVLATHLLGLAGSDGPQDVRCDAARAEALALGGDWEDAAVALEAALARAPADGPVRLYAGRVELARAEASEGDAAARALEAAEAHFRRALALDPRSASAWFGLGSTLDRAGRADEALAALGGARRHGWSASLDLTLGELELERGRTQRAVELLWPLVQDPHGGPARVEAYRLLDEAGLLPVADQDAGG